MLHHRDRYYLGSFGGDCESGDLLDEYHKYQKAWWLNNVGGLPVPTNLMLAIKYPKGLKPIVTPVKEEDVPVQITKTPISVEVSKAKKPRRKRSSEPKSEIGPRAAKRQ